MIGIIPAQVTPRLRSLFDPALPAGVRCFAVLEGHAAGRILTDDPAHPAWAIVQEAAFGGIYSGGAFDAPLWRRLVDQLRQDGDVLVGLWPGDERFRLLPPNPDYEGSVLEFTDRPFGQGLDAYLRRMPGGCEIHPVDRALFERCAARDLYVAMFGGAEQALQKGFGVCLMRGDEIVCQAFAGPAALGLIEIGATTSPGHEGRGYATITCAHLIRACEGLGFQTYWNCAGQNLASAAVARKLGYTTEKEYRLAAWLKSKGGQL